MKKLLIAAFAAMVGVAASAATYSWKASNDWYSPDGIDDLSGTAYIFDGSVYSIDTVVSALTGSLGNALDSQDLDYGAFYFEGAGLTDDGTDNAHMFVIVVNDAGDGYWASEMVNVAITDAIKGGGQASFAFGDIEDISFTAIHNSIVYQGNGFVKICDGNRNSTYIVILTIHKVNIIL